MTNHLLTHGPRVAAQPAPDDRPAPDEINTRRWRFRANKDGVEKRLFKAGETVPAGEGWTDSPANVETRDEPAAPEPPKPKQPRKKPEPDQTP